MSCDSRSFQEIPTSISSADHDRLELAPTLSLQERLLLYEELLEHYSEVYDSHPFLLERLANIYVELGSGPLAVDLYRKAQRVLVSMNRVDKDFDDFLDRYSIRVDEQVNRILIKSQQGSYYQKWKRTKEHRFPTNLPQLPPGTQELKERWQTATTANPAFSDAYLRKFAIETNHVEDVFLLTEESAQDLISRGISEGTVECLPGSALQDSSKIKSILTDTLAAFELMRPLVANASTLNTATICAIHARLMKTCRFGDTHYVPAGKTRTTTRATVVVEGTYRIECCPFPDVDAEVEYICKMAKQWVKTWRNPFATASWIHLVLVRCHPFSVYVLYPAIFYLLTHLPHRTAMGALYDYYLQFHFSRTVIHLYQLHSLSEQITTGRLARATTVIIVRWYRPCSVACRKAWILFSLYRFNECMLMV